MPFKLRPILSEMKDMYSKPISGSRFQEYLFKLQGNTKGELILPIMGFNPMAKEHVLLKLEELEELNAEVIMQDAIHEVNLLFDTRILEDILVVLNVADDLKGAWTNFYTTDFESKFNRHALTKRNFCAPYFWTSETYSSELIKCRTKAYLLRSIYAKANPKPTRLMDYVEQEKYVAKYVSPDGKNKDNNQFEFIDSFYKSNKQSEQYDLIFNFFYGDEASVSLAYTPYGNDGVCGFDYARFLSSTQNQ